MAKKLLPKPKTAGPTKSQKTDPRPKTKKSTCIDMLRRPKGASLAELQKATGWQPHSVRGFLSGTVKKMPGIALAAEVTDDSGRRYRIEREKTS